MTRPRAQQPDTVRRAVLAPGDGRAAAWALSEGDVRAGAAPRVEQANGAGRAADASTCAASPGKARATPTAGTAAPAAYASTGAGTAH